MGAEYTDLDDILNEIEDKTDYHYKIKFRKTEEFEWDDDLKINNINAKIEDFEEYFK